MSPPESSPENIALTFVQALVQGTFEVAHALLTPALQQQYSVERLQQVFEEMVAYGETPPNAVEVMATLADWPGKTPEDWGWVYVSVAGDGYGEAVTVIVQKNSRIRDLEWGRP